MRRRPPFRTRLNSERVWELLNRLNISQNELARQCGLSSGYLSQMITGTRFPSPAVRKGLMEVLAIERFDDLFILERAA